MTPCTSLSVPPHRGSQRRLLLGAQVNPMFQSTLSQLQDHVGILGQPLARSASTSWNTSWKELAFGRHIRPGQIRGGTLPCLSQRGEGFLPEFEFALVLSIRGLLFFLGPQGDVHITNTSR